MFNLYLFLHLNKYKIININQKLKLGKPVAMSIQGFGDPYRMPQELFVYLSERLFEEFQYLNPGAEFINSINSNLPQIDDDNEYNNNDDNLKTSIIILI